MKSPQTDYGTTRKKVGAPCPFPFCSALILYQALARDGFQCVITGIVDEDSAVNNIGLRRWCEDQGRWSVRIEVCHILSEPVTQDTVLRDRINSMNRVCSLSSPSPLALTDQPAA